jgi:hypothetical protein
MLFGTTYLNKMNLNLKKIQLEACKIKPGTTKLVAIANLYEDTYIQPLKVTKNTIKLFS